MSAAPHGAARAAAIAVRCHGARGEALRPARYGWPFSARQRIARRWMPGPRCSTRVAVVVSARGGRVPGFTSEHYPNPKE